MLNAAGQADGEGYILPPASAAADECQRLDDLHAGFRQYFGGQLCLAPIAEERPSKIIDLGCGSGAWAIQAAVQFPDAEVLAADISPLPDRTLPSNVVFVQVDVTKELNFDPETFDIVHCRLVVTHIQNARNVIERVARLVRPGGLLLLEDMDLSRLRETAVPTVNRIVSRFMESMAARGGDPEIGRKLEGIIGSLASFEHVHADKITVPCSGISPDHESAANTLGLAVKMNVRRAFVDFLRRHSGQAVSEDMIEQYDENLAQSGCEATYYFCWARRSAE
ncbi:S-adenosyl-L-methionine-dependent methyltransferase [Mycena latifolia]|nr:S-adenosyl-L-methionine-dependent methyltransferase [Mycena latifolia]